MSVELSERRRSLGMTLVLASALLFSASGVLTKAIDAGAWTVLTWRGLLGALGVGLYVRLVRRDLSARAALRLDAHGWLIAGVAATGSVTFITAFKNTFVANVSVIYATIPFAAAVLDRVLRGEPTRRQVLRASGWSLVGVVVIVAGSLGTPNVGGDLVAVVMVGLNALYMVLIRAFPETDAVLASAAGAGLLFVVGWPFVDPLDVSAGDAVLLVAFGVVFAVATVLWTEGTRRIPAAESGLLGTAETPIAIVLAWVALAEVPPAASVVGAVIVMVAVVAHAVRPWLSIES